MWQRSDVDPGDVFVDRNGHLWEVISIADSPTVTLRAVNRTFPELSNHVISSPLFAETYPEKMERRKPDFGGKLK